MTNKTLRQLIREKLEGMHTGTLKRICFNFELTNDQNVNWTKIDKAMMIAMILVRIVDGKNGDEDIDILLNNYIPAPEM